VNLVRLDLDARALGQLGRRGRFSVLRAVGAISEYSSASLQRAAARAVCGAGQRFAREWHGALASAGREWRSSSWNNSRGSMDIGDLGCLRDWHSFLDCPGYGGVDADFTGNVQAAFNDAGGDRFGVFSITPSEAGLGPPEHASGFSVSIHHRYGDDQRGICWRRRATLQGGAGRGRCAVLGQFTSGA